MTSWGFSSAGRAPALHAGGQEFESPILHHFRRAFSSVGRASPLQGEGQKFESSNAHHKKQDDISYPVFYFVVLMTWTSNCVSNLRSSADLRTDDARSASPDSEQIEPAGAKPLRRNSVSVEQIQEESFNA